MVFTALDVHWTSGFIEGDGSIVLAGKSPRLQATQAEYAPLQKLKDLWGGTICPKKHILGRKPLHSWALGGEVAVGLMMMIYDLMSPPRKQQIQSVLNQWKMNGAISGEKHYRSKLADDDAIVAMRRVLDGESMTSVAYETGMSHASLSMWISGKHRPDLLRKLRGEKTYSNLRTIGAISPVFVTTRHSHNTLLQNLHWTAGFVESEGHFSPTVNMSRIIATQVERFPLEKLKTLWGGYIYDRKPTAQHNAISDWHLNGADAVALMMTLSPLMSPSRKSQIRTSLIAWRLRKVPHGETHYGATVSDDDALSAMRRVVNGEGVTAVARDIGVHHVVLSMWLRGVTRSYLMKQLGVTYIRKKICPSGESNHNTTISDNDAIAAMVRVYNGEGMYAVAKSIGISGPILSEWLRGRSRPYLLKRVQEEQQQEVSSYA